MTPELEPNNLLAQLIGPNTPMVDALLNQSPEMASLTRYGISSMTFINIDLDGFPSPIPHEILRTLPVIFAAITSLINEDIANGIETGPEQLDLSDDAIATHMTRLCMKIEQIHGEMYRHGFTSDA